MKLKNKLLCIAMLLAITPMYSKSAIDHSMSERNRKVRIKTNAHEIVQITEQIDQTIQLRELFTNQQKINKILKDIDILKRLRDLKIRELDILRQSCMP